MLEPEFKTYRSDRGFETTVSLTVTGITHGGQQVKAIRMIDIDGEPLSDQLTELLARDFAFRAAVDDGESDL